MFKLPPDVYSKIKLMRQQLKRHSIIHILNAIITTPITIRPSEKFQSDRYVIGYEPKVHTVHDLVYKIDKRLLKQTQQNGNITVTTDGAAVDINVKEDHRAYLRYEDPHKVLFYDIRTIARIVPTRYADKFKPLYVSVQQFKWRSTNKGGEDDLRFKIQQCPTIATSETVKNVCYKIISSQVSRSGLHGVWTYVVVAPQRGTYEIGVHYYRSNSGKTVKHLPVTVTL